MTKVKIACMVPRQTWGVEESLAWLENLLAKTTADLVLLPQEWLGGHMAAGRGAPLHVERGWLVETVGLLAKKYHKHIGIGAAVQHSSGGATEDYLYFDDEGDVLGHHRKFALPSYDDVRSNGAGRLWPESSYVQRVTPVRMPKLGLVIGTVFCWEVFSLTIFPAYSFAGCNLIVHPIKFAPRGWLKLKHNELGKAVVGFDQAPKSTQWLDKLRFAGAHEVMCPIAISCNSWDLGPKYMALTGHVDEILGTTDLIDVPSTPEAEVIHEFEMNPAYYTALDSMHSAGAFKAHAGSLDGYQQMGAWKMHAKVRRLEAHLMGGTTRLDMLLKANQAARQKPSSLKRAQAKGLA